MIIDYAHTINRVREGLWSCTFKSQDSRLNGSPCWKILAVKTFPTREGAATWGAKQCLDEIEEPCGCGELCCNMGETCKACAEV